MSTMMWMARVKESSVLVEIKSRSTLESPQMNVHSSEAEGLEDERRLNLLSS